MRSLLIIEHACIELVLGVLWWAARLHVRVRGGVHHVVRVGLLAREVDAAESEASFKLLLQLFKIDELAACWIGRLVLMLLLFVRDRASSLVMCASTDCTAGASHHLFILKRLSTHELSCSSRTRRR